MHELLLLFSFLGLLSALPSAAQTFKPPTIPLTARSPYLLTFLPGTDYQADYIKENWAIGISNRAIFGWVGIIRVDGVAYSWLADINFSVNSSLVESQPQLTPTSSVYTLQAGPLRLTVTFLSPIESNDPVNQSIPASYVALEAQSIEGGYHSVQVYTDISAEWVSGNRAQNVTWHTSVTNSGVLIHSISATEQYPYQEIEAQSAWGSISYATLTGTNVTYKTASDKVSRPYFMENGKLDNGQNTTFRPITVDWPVFAFAHDLGTIQQTSEPLVWAVANIRDSDATGAATYTDLSQKEQGRSLYYRSQYNDDSALLGNFLADYPEALSRSQTLDKNLTQAAQALGGQQYADILALATRQAYSGIEITIARNTDGSVNASDVMVLYKDTGLLGTNGTGSRVSPVDGLMSIFPMFLHIDINLCGGLLEPLFRFQNSDAYSNPYAALDLGNTYPRAYGSNASHSNGVESSSGMIIMAYSHAKMAEDNSIIARYYTLLGKWGRFLVSNVPSVVYSDSALKGIIAISAMSNISAMMNDSASSDMFSSQANSLYSQWKTKALAPDGHLRYSYNDTEDSSFALGQSMFWDLVLGTKLLDTSVIDTQVNYLANVIKLYGAPTNSTNTSLVAADSNMLAAAVATRNTHVQQLLIGATHSQAGFVDAARSQIWQFPLIYDAQNGTMIAGYSSPRQGAVYAPLLVSNSSFRGQSSIATSHSSMPVGTIVGATVGAIAGLSLIAGLLFLIRRRRRSSTREAMDLADPFATPRTTASPSTLLHAGVTPFQEIDTSASHESASSDIPLLPDIGSKRALRLRQARQLSEQAASVGEQEQESAIHAPTTTTTSELNDRTHAQRMMHEINSIWREISALRTNEGAVAPPEYDG